jgi:DNA polymerase-4
MQESLRKIIHIDMDAFYAAVEQRDNLQYRNKPIIVGGKPDSRGVVATCSYEARMFGIHSAMPSAQAIKLCPQAIFVKPRFDAYRECSEIIRHIFDLYSDQVEPLSLDEAYLDVSSSLLHKGSATLLARQIKQDIQRETQLIASAGISYNKFLAKIASDMGKPNGLYLIRPDQALAFIEKLPIAKFHGIGPATENKMRGLGINNGHDLKQVSLLELQRHFGKAAGRYYDIARGVDNRPVNAHRDRKSIGVETTFDQDINQPELVLYHLQQLLQQAVSKLQAKQLMAYTLTIKIKYQNFVQITRGRTLQNAVMDSHDCRLVLADLLKNTSVGEKKVRLLGVTLSNLRPHNDMQQYQQLDIFNFNY